LTEVLTEVFSLRTYGSLHCFYIRGSVPVPYQMRGLVSLLTFKGFPS